MERHPIKVVRVGQEAHPETNAAVMYMLMGNPPVVSSYMPFAKAVAATLPVVVLRLDHIAPNERVAALMTFFAQQPTEMQWLFAHSYGGFLAYEVLKQNVAFRHAYLFAPYLIAGSTAAEQRIKYMSQKLRRHGMTKGITVLSKLLPRQWFSNLMYGIDPDDVSYHSLWDCFHTLDWEKEHIQKRRQLATPADDAQTTLLFVNNDMWCPQSVWTQWTGQKVYMEGFVHDFCLCPAQSWRLARWLAPLLKAETEAAPTTTAKSETIMQE